MPERVSLYELEGQLMQLDTRGLARFAERIGMDYGGRENAQQLRAAITDFLSDPQTIVERIGSLPLSQRRALAAVAIAGEGRTGPFVVHGDRDEAALHADYQELVRRGFLFQDPSYSYGREPGFIVPRELLYLFAQGASYTLQEQKHPSFLRAEITGESAGPELLAALLRVVGEVGRQPLQLTQQGSVYKRDLDRLRKVRGAGHFAAASPAWARLERVLSGAAERLVDAPWSEAGRDVGMLLWIGLALGLLHAGRGVVFGAIDWQELLAAGGREELWRNGTLSLTDMLMHKAVSALIVLRMPSEETWFAPLDWMPHVYGVPLRVSTLESQQVAALSLLAAGELGLLEAAMVGEQPAVRLSPVGAALLRDRPLPELPIERHVRILPSGDILATDYLDPATQAGIEKYARPTAVDVMTTYRLDQGLVATAASEGVPAQAILGFFEAASRDELPQPVRFRLEEWLQDVGSVRFMEVALIACESAEMRARALSVPLVRKESLELLGDRWIVIPAASEERLRAALQAQGIIPVAEVHRPSGLATERTLRQHSRLSPYLGSLRLGVETYGLPLGEDAHGED